MNKLCTVLFIVFLFTSCGSNKKNYNKEKTEASGNAPEWVYTPMAGCQKQTEMCASGEGDSFQAADANARKSLASIFETEIKSEFSSQTSSSQEGLDPSTAEYLENTFKQINETVDQSLEGVEIKTRFDTNGVYYSLAVLDKRKAADVLRKEMREIDKKLELMFEKNKRSLYKKMMAMYEVRDSLATRYHFLTEMKPDEKVTLVDINSIKYGKTSKVLKIKIENNGELGDIAKNLKNVLAQVGHKIVTNNEDVTVKVDIAATKEFFNVAGFEKYTFTLNISSLNGNGSKIGSIVSSQTATGRNKQDVFRKVQAKLNNVVDEQLEELNID